MAQHAPLCDMPERQAHGGQTELEVAHHSSFTSVVRMWHNISAKPDLFEGNEYCYIHSSAGRGFCVLRNQQREFTEVQLNAEALVLRSILKLLAQHGFD